MISEVELLAPNSTVYHINDGFYYKKHTDKGNRMQLRCVNRGNCPGTASMPLSKLNRVVNSLRHNTNHNHEPSLRWMEVLLLKKAILVRCANERTPYSTIFREETGRVSKEVASQLNYNGLTSTMWRSRFQPTMKRRMCSYPRSSRQENSSRAESNNENQDTNQAEASSSNQCTETEEDLDEEKDKTTSTEPDQQNEQTRTETSAGEARSTEETGADENQIQNETENQIENETENIDDITDLKSVVKKLQAVSDKLSAFGLGDSHDQFGKYMASLLRGLPAKRVVSLKQKMVSEVLEALLAHERGIPDNFLSADQTSKPSQNCSNGQFLHQTQNPTPTVDVPVMPLATDQAQNNLMSIQMSASQPMFHIQNLTNTTQMLNPTNLPMVVPTASIAGGAYTLVPMIPMNMPSGSGPPPLVATTNMVGSIGGDRVSQCETVRTVSASQDGTLLALTLPTRIPGVGPPSTVEQKTPKKRGRKRKVPTQPAYLVKRLAPADNTAVGPAEPEDSSSSNCNPLGESYTDEFKIDIEEGKELNDVKDLNLHNIFESVMCGESSYVKVKEEAPDFEDETTDERLGESMTDNSTHTAACDMCSAQCNSYDELRQHFTLTHPGCVPTFKEESNEPQQRNQCL